MGATRADEVHAAAPGEALARERYSATQGWFWTASAVGAVVLAVYLAVAIPTFGWLPFLLVGVTTVAGPLSVLVVGEASERAYAWGTLIWLVGLGFTAAFAGGADSFLLPLLVAYMLAFFCRLRPAVAIGYATSAYALAVTPVLVVDWDGFADSPWLLLSCTIGVFSMTMFASQMAAGELQQRGQATIDQLTGLLNRRGLEDRLAELGQQAFVIGNDIPLSVIACDLDHFKSVNDVHGHQRGDDVLCDVAYIIRKVLRRFELIYRMGGEEFLVVLPGADLAAAAEAAESIRVAVETGRPGGLDVTMSLGVATCSGPHFEPEQLLAEADTALYDAKRQGRNRVMQAACLAGTEPHQHTPVKGSRPERRSRRLSRGKRPVH